MLDIIVGAGYLIGIVGLGAYFYRSQHSTKDFFLAGRSMSWLPIGFSMVATLTSGAGFIAQPAAAVKYGLIYLWVLMAIPLCFPVVTWVFIPFYRRLQVYTTYEYLERRFDVSVRTLTSAIFILWRITWMAAVIYVPSMVLNIVTDGKLPMIPSIIGLGLLATAYTALGGIKAVIWTDVIQFVIMFGGMTVAGVIIYLNVPGGVGEIWSVLEEAGKTAMTASKDGLEHSGFLGSLKFYLYTDITVAALIISPTLSKLGYYCVDHL